MTAANTDMKIGFWLGLFMPVFIGLILAPTLLWRAYVLAQLWGWYVTPALGLPPLRIVFAYGILVLVMLLKGRGSKSDDKLRTMIGQSLLGPAFLLLLGWIGTLFI